MTKRIIPAISNRNASQGQNLFFSFREGHKHSTLKRNCIKMKVKTNAESCSNFLSFVPKLRCSQKKSPKISFYVSISVPNVFEQSRRTFLGNLHYSLKTRNRRWVEGWTSPSYSIVSVRKAYCGAFSFSAVLTSSSKFQLYF